MDWFFVAILALGFGYFAGHRHHEAWHGNADDVEISPPHKRWSGAGHSVNANISGEEISIGYRDSKGKETERPIRVLNIGETKNGKLTILAFCFLRENVRMFLVDRITRVIDSNGVIHEPHEFFDGIYLKASTKS